MSPEKANVEQALLSDEGKAEDIVKAVKSGKSLSDAVKAATGDTKSYQGKNSFSQDGLPTVIATPVFAAKSGDIIGPIKSPLGFHIIKVAGIDAAKPVSFDGVKDKIRKELEDEKSGDAVFTVTSEIEDRLAGGEKFEDMKGEFPLTLSTVKNLTKGSAVPKEMGFAGKNSAAVLAKAFTVTQDAPSELKEAGSSLLYSIRLDKMLPAAPKPFAAVKDIVLKKWIAANQAQDNMLAAQKKVDDITAGREKFSSLRPQTILSLTRAGSEKLAKDVTERFMTADKGKTVMAISKEKDGVYIGRVTSISLPKTKDAKESDIKSQLEADLASATYMGYLASLQNKYDVTVNDGLLKRAYGTTKDDQ
jgi:peptidyl-prolyl cis-trans isomerase D